MLLTWLNANHPNMDNILLSTILAFAVTFVSIPAIIQVAKSKKLFDEPDERKVHKIVIPTLGGLGIFAGLIIAILMGAPTQPGSHLQYFVAALMVIFFLGLKDDILILSASKKFIGQVLAAGILVYFADIRITSMYGLLGINELPYLVSIVLTLFTVVVITNSFNLIDGVDGLAGSLGLITSVIFGIYFTMAGEVLYAVMAFSLAGSLVAFLIYNFHPAQIFMGDTGSLLIGILNAIFVIKFITVASSPLAAAHVMAAPAMGVAVLIVPLADTLRVVGLRIINRRSPFSPDRNHIHHFMLELGMSHRQITCTCVTVNFLFIALAYNLRQFGANWALLAVASCAVLFMSLVYYKKTRRSITATPHTMVKKAIVKSHKILRLTPDKIESEAV